jgi:hypothetical protein
MQVELYKHTGTCRVAAWVLLVTSDFVLNECGVTASEIDRESDDHLKSLDTAQYTTSLYIDYSHALIAPSHLLTFSPRRQQGQQSKMSITTQPTLRGATAVCPGACIHGTNPIVQ